MKTSGGSSAPTGTYTDLQAAAPSSAAASAEEPAPAEKAGSFFAVPGAEKIFRKILTADCHLFGELRIYECQAMKP